MVDIPLLIAFLAAASVLTMTPGVDTAMVLRAAAVEGRNSAIMAASGIALGCLFWGGAVSLGLGALLRASELAYGVVKLAGAAYLLWLGLKLLIKPRTVLDVDIT
jgi:threonine/homoserine/homoserine lactone efflux protein